MTTTKRFIIGYVVAAIVPLLLVAFFTVYTVTEYIKNQTSETLLKTTTLISPEFDNIILSIFSEIKVLTQSDVFEEGNKFTISQYLNEVLKEMKIKKDIYYFDTSGNEVAKSGLSHYKNINISNLNIDFDFFQKLLNSKQGDVFITDAIKSGIAHDYFVIISPVTDDANTIIIGALALKVPFTIFSNTIKRLQDNIGKERTAYITDMDGNILIPNNENHNNIKQIRENKNINDLNIHILTDIKKLGTSGQLIRSEPGGRKELIIFQRLLDEDSPLAQNWTLLIRVPWKSITEPGYELSKYLTLLSLMILIAAIFAGILFARSYTVPLARITAFAQRLVDTKGELDLSTAAMEPIETGPRELVILSQGLSTAIGHIASRTHDMEMALIAADQARADAERASNARASFLAVMSHEVRTPLNGMLGMIQLIELGEDITPQQRERLGLARSAGEGLLQILTDVLDITKIESETFELEETDFKIDEIVSPILSIYEQTASPTVHIHHNCLIDSKTAFLGDPIRIRQIIWNLVGNAVKFTPEGSINIETRIRSSESSRSKKLSITISDTGVGIKEEDQKRILEPFNQADGSLTRRFEGVGLGLSIVQKLLSAMGGDLSIVSMVGKGTVVSVDIPIKTSGKGEQRPAGREPQINSPGRIDAPVRSALIVDDNKLNAVVASELLKKAGYETFVAGSGREALDVLNNRQIDFVILDQHMPIMDGTATAAAIRNHPDPAISTVTIVGLTADTRKSNKEAMENAGMNIVLTKPVRHEALYMALANLTPPQNDNGSSAQGSAS
tara:strand:+ start:744 stop:3116 length:2373 start_codon:yes stop_codon:yes gene_type:complete